MSVHLRPKDHAEEVALFRAQVLGPVLNRELHRGELLAELRVLAKHRFRPPGSTRTRTFSVPTLLRWRRRYLAQGLAGLCPASRRSGNALAVSDETRNLLVDIRQSGETPHEVPVEGLAQERLTFPTGGSGPMHEAGLATFYAGLKDLVRRYPGRRLVLACGKRTLTLKRADLEAYVGNRGSRGARLPRGFQRVDSAVAEA